MGVNFMEQSYLNATVYGIGQLITQRKTLKVPKHQRDFAWSEEEVSQLFNDIIDALKRGDSDYFIGLLVLLGPQKNAWIILDGQQRLASTSMIYAAIRYWLSSRGYDEDAKQIESEFLGARKLGGDIYPRLTLNEANLATFEEFVVNKVPDDDIIERLKITPKRSSERLLLDAALLCRNLVSNFSEEAGEDKREQANLLFSLVNYLETKVKAVVLDLPSEHNAYVIFETLNARGNELSVVDLVKNYLFGNASANDITFVTKNWDEMANRLDDKDADDFLKVFWTSRFGRVQKPQLYSLIKQTFSGEDGAHNLIESLADASEHYNALVDSRHEVWATLGPDCQRNIEILIKLGNRQVRAPIMSAIAKLDQTEMGFLLSSLIVLTVRYQIVGRRRTGALEIACAQLAKSIYSGELESIDSIHRYIAAIVPSDEEFKSDFLSFSERKSIRATYFLLALEKTLRSENHLGSGDIEALQHDPSLVSIEFFLPKTPAESWNEVIAADPDLQDECLYLLGNRFLIEKKLEDGELGNLTFDEIVKGYLSKTDFLLTQMLSELHGPWDRKEIMKRQEMLAELAPKTWRL